MGLKDTWLLLETEFQIFYCTVIEPRWTQNFKSRLIVLSFHFRKYPVCKLSVLAASWTLSEWIFISLAMCALEVIERPLCLLHFGKVDSILFHNNSITLVLITVGANRGLFRGS